MTGGYIMSVSNAAVFESNPPLHTCPVLRQLIAQQRAANQTRGN